MKLTTDWLKEWVDVNVPTEVLLEQLTSLGLEVESCELAAPEFSGVVVAEVLNVSPHPDAKKLNLCQVSTGKGEPLQIVCGAGNVAEGMRVPFATVGAVMPSGLEIKETAVRGINSPGMLCSDQDLGMAETSEGLLVLPNDAPLGEDVRNYLNLDESVIELGITPNRGDCLGVKGVARDICVINKLKLLSQEEKEIQVSLKDSLDVVLEQADACPRYLGRVIKGVDPCAMTPIWMKERLRRGGVRAVSPIVDILNYVMLDLGQPMHAFDLKKIQGNIVVRQAKQGEQLTLLNEDEVTLETNTLVIADDKSALAIAGVMGGLASSVTDETTDLFLESAFFSPGVIAGKARQYKLTTDAAYRYERGVDFNLPLQAIEKATQLILEIAGGQAGPITEAKKDLPCEASVALSVNKLNQVLNIDLPQSEIVEILSSLGLTVTENAKDQLDVLVPSYRFDLKIPEDLIEEVARVYGYDNIPVTQYQGKESFSLLNDVSATEARVKHLLYDLGYQEVITYSFVSKELQSSLDPSAEFMSLLNPISAEMGVMRTSLWPGLLSALKHNLHRQQSRVRLFEMGQQFTFDKDELVQTPMLSGLIVGQRFPEQWAAEKDKVDFFDLKGDLERLLLLGNSSGSISYEKSDCDALHPGQSANVLLNGEIIGRFGALHPSTAQSLGIKAVVYLFELQARIFNLSNQPIYAEISKYPAVRRDFAILLNKSVTTQCLEAAIKEVVGELLVDMTVFDVFTGKGIDEDMRSIALGLTLQHASRTLKDEEVAELSKRVVDELHNQYGAELRE